MSNPPPLDRVVTPTTTFVGAMLRIADKARTCGSTARIDCDPRTWLELQKILAQEFGAPYDLLRLDAIKPNSPRIFMFDGIEFGIRRPPNE